LDKATPALATGDIEVRRIPVRPSRLVRVQRAAARATASGKGGVIRAAGSKLAAILVLVTEGRDDWRRRALDEGRSVFRERAVDSVWTTSGPYRSIGIGRRLQREFGTPWVADLRDAVAREPSSNDGHGALRVLGRRRWYPVLRKASAVTCVSPEEAAMDAETLGRRVEPIPSGFDRATWESVRRRAAADGPKGPRFLIVYAGTLHRLHDPAMFFSGLRRLLDTGVPEQSVAFVYLGHHTARVLAEADRHGVRHVVVADGRVPVREARLAMARADLLLLLASVNGESGIPGGKLYEYLAAGPPILAVPDTDSYVMGVLRDARAGDGASTPDEVADALLRRYTAWRDGIAISRPLRDLGAFSWSARAERVSALLGGRVAGLGGAA
jgi:glycosyltransferase involved in cell wall biosynthesis